MRVLCLIDNLGSGGAQRQLCTLAVQLRRRGVDVSVLTYHPHDFFLPMLQQAGVPYQTLPPMSPARRILAIRKRLRQNQQEAVLAFLDTPALLAELAALPMRRWGLVVSERSAVPGSHLKRLPWRRLLHQVADYVTTNSHTNRLMIEAAVPALRGRVVTVYNTVDLEYFSPSPVPNGSSMRVVVAASFQWIKNVHGVISAMGLLSQQAPHLDVKLDWYGDQPSGPDVYDYAVQQIHALGLEGRVTLHHASAAIRDIYREADAVLLASFFEGLPNTICEALACGRPVLCSAVCDAGNLVKPGDNGDLFDPTAPGDIARALRSLAEMPHERREHMGRCSREMAERLFYPELHADAYLQVLHAANARSKETIAHSVPDVPQTALRTLHDAVPRVMPVQGV